MFDSLTTKSTKSDENFQKNRIYLSISLSIYLSIYDENKFKIFKSTVHIIYIHTDSLYFKVREIEFQTDNQNENKTKKQWNNKNDKKNEINRTVNEFFFLFEMDDNDDDDDDWCKQKKHQISNRN